MKWQILSPQSLHLRCWDNQAVAYDALSGSTHLLGHAAAQVLAEIQRAPADAAFLAQALASGAPGQAAEDREARLTAILAELAAVSLIVPATP